MSFQSFGFLAFAAVTVGLCLLMGRRGRLRLGLWLLLAACVVFYESGGAGLGMLLLSGWIVWWSARCLARETGPARRWIFLLTLMWLVGTLVAYKYAAFLTGGLAAQRQIPLGLSFFTFQQIWYLKEVYTGDFPSQPPAEYALYTLFFPTVSSGPILKPQSFFPQLAAPSFLRPAWQDGAAGLYAIACGMAKKVLLADALGVVVNNGWAALADLSAPMAWLVILGYTLQLYFDFSGYCDIAAGITRLLGVRLPANFNSPYRSLSVGEFWKRWHITLTSFLRECVYFPLGGSRRGTVRTCGNILLVFLISGFWHGAGWTFLAWGALHGLAQVAERVWGPGRERLPKVLRWAMTFLFLNVAWVFFRAPSLTAAKGLLTAAFTGGAGGSLGILTEGLFSSEADAVSTLAPALAGPWPLLILGALFAAGLLAALWPRNALHQMDAFRPSLWRAAVLAAALCWAVLSFSDVTTFIYSNF